MAKSKGNYHTCLWVFICLLLVSYELVGETPRERVKKTYTSQIGVREATGNNDGLQVEKYLKVSGFGSGFAWCAAFLAWTFEQSQIKAIKSAWAPSWFPMERVIYLQGSIKETPQYGDVMGIWINGRIGHVGFVDEWGDKIVITVEGNTSDTSIHEGDGVYRKRRLKQQIFAVSKWL